MGTCVSIYLHVCVFVCTACKSSAIVGKVCVFPAVCQCNGVTQCVCVCVCVCTRCEVIDCSHVI